MQNDIFKAIIGLEIHAQLKTNRKIFSPEIFEFGAIPNSLISPITLSHPGTLPIINAEVILPAIKLGLALNSEITKLIYFDRKNYFYPDLPKGYQITQDKTPICVGGQISFNVNNEEKTIHIFRIHLEEDAGKLIHEDKYINIDFNRAGVALVEIVTAPEFESGYEVFCFLHELRRIVRYLNICNGNMEEGSLRCDTNISLKNINSSSLAQRVEVKNINSISNVQKTIDYEIKRQKNILINNGKIEQETRMFDDKTGTTIFQRKKEKMHDYKYFVEPDLNPIFISQEIIDKIKAEIPLLPHEYKKKLIKDFCLTEYQANVLIENQDLLFLFEEIVSDNFKNYKIVANWILGPIKGIINKLKINFNEITIKKEQFRELISLVINNEISYTVASQEVLPFLFEHSDLSPKDIIEQKNLSKNENLDFIEELVEDILNIYPNKILEYKNGKKGLLGFFVGEVIKKSENKADPKIVNKILLSKIT